MSAKVLKVATDANWAPQSFLNDKKVGAGTATTFELYLQHDLQIDAEGVPAFEYQLKAENKSYKDSTAAMDDLRLGDGVRINGMVGSLPAILAAIKAKYPLRVLGEPVFYEPLALAIDAVPAGVLALTLCYGACHWRMELIFLARTLGDKDFKHMEMLITAALIYWTLSMCLEVIQSRIERHYRTVGHYGDQYVRSNNSDDRCQQMVWRL